VMEWDESQVFPLDVFRALGRLGVLGAVFPEELGGSGYSYIDYSIVMEEIARVDPSIALSVAAHVSLCANHIYIAGNDEQRRHYVPKLASGEWIGCWSLTEPEAGSDAGGTRTAAVRDGDAWVLNGEKTWITNGSMSDVALVWARAAEGIVGFLVERGTPGFSTSDIHGKWSMRASVTSSLSFSDCRVSECDRLPGARGLKAPLSCLSQARFGIGWGVVGAAMDCYETARAYSVVRKQFDDRPIASHQLVQEKLAWMITEITKAQLLAVQAGRLKDQGKIEPAHISMLKRNNVAIALDCARLSRDLLGANGITDEYPIMRHLCNLETVKTYEGTDHIHALVIGERVTGVAAYK